MANKVDYISPASRVLILQSNGVPLTTNIILHMASLSNEQQSTFFLFLGSKCQKRIKHKLLKVVCAASINGSVGIHDVLITMLELMLEVIII